MALRGYCTFGCIDNGTNSPSGRNPPVDFGFTADTAMSGSQFIYAILVPNNELVLSVDLFGTHTATAFQIGMWNTGGLAAVLGITATPNLAIGAFVPSTQAINPGASGFTVFTATIPGPIDLEGVGYEHISPLQRLSASPYLPIGSYIVGFLNTGSVPSPNWMATLFSGAIFVYLDPDVPQGVKAIFVA